MHEVPLAERMRPRTLEDYLGQGHLVGEDQVLRRSVDGGNVPSMILWGPPGVGKTTLAKIIASQSNRPFHELSAVQSGVRKSVKSSGVKRSGMFSGRAILFIDEIHRFSKSQQDSLLGAVEKGLVTLIGATTENPSFEVIPALMSRCQTYVLQSFDDNQLKQIVNRAIAEDEALSMRTVEVKEWEALLRASSGDARRLLNAVELLVGLSTEDPVVIDNASVKAALQSSTVRFDKKGDAHYDIASALIKSIRGSDPNAAVYYLARMLSGGEDPKFIARRLVIAAAEDIGLANPTALVMANETFAAVERIGTRTHSLSRCVIYLATNRKAMRRTLRLTGDAGCAKDDDLPVPLPQCAQSIHEGPGFGKATSTTTILAKEPRARSFCLIPSRVLLFTPPVTTRRRQTSARRCRPFGRRSTVSEVLSA